MGAGAGLSNRDSHFRRVAHGAENKTRACSRTSDGSSTLLAHRGPTGGQRGHAERRQMNFPKLEPFVFVWRITDQGVPPVPINDCASVKATLYAGRSESAAKM